MNVILLSALILRSRAAASRRMVQSTLEHPSRRSLRLLLRMRAEVTAADSN
jgi:hypothetical protein